MKQGKNSLMAINPAGTGDISESGVVWKKSKGLPYVPSPIVYDGRVFFIRDGGFASSYDAATGKAFYESKRIGTADKYYASPIAAAGYIYLASLDQGTISVLKANADKPEVVAERKLEERVARRPHWWAISCTCGRKSTCIALPNRSRDWSLVIYCVQGQVTSDK